MDNFLTRLVKRTLGLMPVVQPMIASIFTPTEVVLDNYPSEFETENNTTESFLSRETGLSSSPDLPVRSPSNLPVETLSLPANKISSLSTFNQLVEPSKNEPIIDNYTIEIVSADRERAIVPQITPQENLVYNKLDLEITTGGNVPEIATPTFPSSQILPELLSPQRSKGEEKPTEKTSYSGTDELFDIDFKSNFNQTPNSTLPNEQLNTFNIVPTAYFEEVTPSQKSAKEKIERVEPLVNREIETALQTETQYLDAQTVRSQLETNRQQKDISTVRYTNDVPRRENPLSRIKSLVDRIFQTQQRRDNNFSSPPERVEIQPNLLPSNLNLENTSRGSTFKVSSMQPTAHKMIQPYKTTENTTLPTAGQEINSPVNLPPEFFLANFQSNSALTEGIKAQNIPNSQTIKQNISELETIAKIQPVKDLIINQVEHLKDNEVMPVVEPARGITNLNQPRNYPKVNKLNISDRDTAIAPSTTSDSQQSQIFGEIQSVNRSISQQQLIQLVPRQSTDRSSTRSDQQENPRLGNKERPEIKVYAISSGNKFISEQTPILINSNLKVNQKSELEPQTSSDFSRSEKEREYEREFAFLTRRLLAVLSQSSSKQSSVDPIANNLLEFRQLNSTNRREVANADRTTWQNISDAETTIQITIGRLEVRTNNQPTSSTPKSKSTQRGPTVSLQDYLKQRQGEK